MNIEMKQENFSHRKCQACGHFAVSEKFNPEMVPLEKSNLPNIKWEITQSSEGLELNTINYTCPICGSPYVEPYFGTELN